MKRVRVVFLLLGLTLLPAPRTSAITSYYPPLSSQVDLSEVPGDFARPASDGGPPIGERIRVKQFNYAEIKNAMGRDIGAHLTLNLIITQGFELQVPGLESVASIVFAQGEMQAEAIMREEHALDPAEDYPFILKLRPPANLISLRFKSDVLKPVQPVTFQPYTGTPPFPELQLAANLEVRVRYSWDGDADFELVDAAGLRPTLTLNTPVTIGDTGMVLEIQDAEIDFSRTSSAAGAPPSWIGVRFRRLAISFTNGLAVPRVEAGAGAPPPPAGISVTDFSIGSGGVSGGITGTFPTPGPNFPLFGSNFEVRTIGITLDQGALTAGAVNGILQQFPYFQNPVQLSLNLSLDGSFKVGLAPDPANPGALLDLTAPGVLVFHVEAFSLEKKLDLYTWKMSGKININAISTAPADAIPVNGLSITSNGEVALDGGWLVLPGKKTIDFRGFAVELAEIGFGSEEPPAGPPAKKWVGFSGGIQLSSGFDAAARFKRLQFVWPGGGADAYDVRLAGIEINFRRPGVISFTGALDFFEDPVSGTEGFAGAVACNVEAIRLAISGRLVVGKASPPAAPQFPFFYVDLAVSLPAGVPLFPGVSLYGFLGQFAYNVNPNIEAFTTPIDWFQAHTMATNLLSGSPPPWRVRDGSFAVGAGALVGTTPDDGFSANAKIAVTVALPGPVVVLQGAANVVRSRGDLLTGANPNFTCLAVFDGNNNTFLLNIGAYYSVANLIVVSGQAEAFFNLNDPNDWHVWIGKDQPETRRIRAEVLSFLKANSYFMIDSTAFKNGAKAGYDGRWRFGPLRVTLVAFFAYDMRLFYRPVDVWGIVQVKGEFEISAFGIGIGLSAHASLEGETPRPFFVEGTFHVKLSLPWPLPDPEAEVHLRWEEQAPKDPLDEWMNGLSIEPRKVPFTVRPDTVSFSGVSSRGAPPATINLSELCAPGSSVAPDHQSEVACAKPLVPLDVVLVAAFQRPTNDVSGLGYGNPFDPGSPRLDIINATQFRYDISSFELVQAHKTGSVLTFDTPLSPLFGVWPAVPGGTTPAALSLRLLSRNPVDVYQTSNYLFYDNDTQGWTEWALGTYGGAYCGPRHENRDPGGRPSLSLARKEPCNIPPTVLNGDDFILPPYSAFRLTVDGDVTRNDPGSDRIYRNTAIFHTEGPPLDVAPYVEMTFPAGERRPHYRGYDVGLRFNETYMDLMYRQAGQDLQLQVLDDNDQPLRLVGSPVAITPAWDQAATHVPRPTEGDWLQFLRDHGVAVDTFTPKDDRVFGRVSAPSAIRGNERYRVRVWLQDPRLATDTRLTDAAWLEKNPVRFIQGNRVVLYEFPLLYSRFETFEQMINTYPGNYVETTVNAAANRTTIATFAAQEGGFVGSFPATLTNASANELGLFLRHALSPSGPDTVGDGERNQWIARAPGYSGKPEQMTDAERNAVLGHWSDALAAYEKIEKELGIEAFRKPLPKTLEVSPLKQGADVIGFLFESPEAIDFTRIELAARSLITPWAAVQVVPNRDNTRFFVFRSAGGVVQPWIGGLTLWRFRYYRTVGDRYPVLRHPDGLNRETAFLVVSIPLDIFTPEAP